MKAMAQGSLPIENIRDHVDVVGRSAWLALAFHGAETRIDCAVNGDWLDTSLVAHLAGLLARADPSKIFLTTEGLGQDSIIVCVTTAQFEEMKRVGIDFRPLASNTP